MATRAPEDDAMTAMVPTKKRKSERTRSDINVPSILSIVSITDLACHLVVLLSYRDICHLMQTSSDLLYGLSDGRVWQAVCTRDFEHVLRLQPFAFPPNAFNHLTYRALLKRRHEVLIKLIVALHTGPVVPDFHVYGGTVRDLIAGRLTTNDIDVIVTIDSKDRRISFARVAAILLQNLASVIQPECFGFDIEQMPSREEIDAGACTDPNYEGCFISFLYVVSKEGFVFCIQTAQHVDELIPADYLENGFKILAIDNGVMTLGVWSEELHKLIDGQPIAKVLVYPGGSHVLPPLSRDNDPSSRINETYLHPRMADIARRPKIGYGHSHLFEKRPIICPTSYYTKILYGIKKNRLTPTVGEQLRMVTNDRARSRFVDFIYSRGWNTDDHTMRTFVRDLRTHDTPMIMAQRHRYDTLVHTADSKILLGLFEYNNTEWVPKKLSRDMTAATWARFRVPFF